jgi:hypothetical protein
MDDDLVPIVFSFSFSVLFARLDRVLPILGVIGNTGLLT